MITRINEFFKEICSVCKGNILIGHLATLCGHCDSICHVKCVEKANYRTFKNKTYCACCIASQDIIRYNPYFDILEYENDSFFENEPTEYIESIQKLSEILENCKSYSKTEFNDLTLEIENGYKNKNSIFLHISIISMEMPPILTNTVYHLISLNINFL